MVTEGGIPLLCQQLDVPLKEISGLLVDSLHWYGLHVYVQLQCTVVEHFLEGLDTRKSHSDSQDPTPYSTWSTACCGQGRPPAKVTLFTDGDVRVHEWQHQRSCSDEFFTWNAACDDLQLAVSGSSATNRFHLYNHHNLLLIEEAFL